MQSPCTGFAKRGPKTARKRSFKTSRIHTMCGAPGAEHPSAHPAAGPLPHRGSTPPAPAHRRTPKPPESAPSLCTTAFWVGDAAGVQKKKKTGRGRRKKLERKTGHTPLRAWAPWSPWLSRANGIVPKTCSPWAVGRHFLENSKTAQRRLETT